MTDIVKTLALGADAVLIGRAYLFALGVKAEQGVRKMLPGLMKEFDSGMAFCGVVKPGNLDKSTAAKAYRASQWSRAGSNSPVFSKL